jgi:predicted O-methyltransferase YrrM
MLTGGLASSRTFFGVQRVSDSAGVHVLTHGSTVHGTQDRRPGREREPRSYYHRTGPVGQLLAEQGERLAGAELGFVGLGTGALAAYGQAGQTMTFFEIDRATLDIARDPELFTYLADSAAQVDVVLGDGRLSLSDQPVGRFDALVLDAFSSGAIPVHLLTREAVELYLPRLRQDGLLVSTSATATSTWRRCWPTSPRTRGWRG